jgi:phage terminase large subunit-like protein
VWLIRFALACLVFAYGPLQTSVKAAPVASSRPYRPEICAYCQAPTWCEIRDNGKPQCRACKVVRFYQEVLYPPLNLKLLPWGESLLRTVYGRVSADNGLRVIRRGYVSMGKQNGKSFLFGGLPIYHCLCEEDIFMPEAYSVASAKDQAGIVFKASALLVRPNPLLYSRLKILESVKRIIRRDGGGVYEVLSADGDVQDGKRPSLLLFDELHRFTRRKSETVRTVLIKGMISRAPVVDGKQTGEPLMLQATTSGDERESPLWYSEYEYARQVIAEPDKDPGYYAVIYQADPKRIESEPEYWKTREARVAANPSHEDNGGFLADSELEGQMKEAVLRPEKYGDFVRLNLNVPVIATGTPIVDMPTWCANGGADDLRKWPEYDVDLLILKWGLKNQPCYLGFDMAWTTDMAGMSLLFPPQSEEEKWKFLFFAWLPQERIAPIEQITRQKLGDWIRRGFLATMPGKRLSVLPIEEKIRWAAKTFDLKAMCFDPYGFKRSAEALAQEEILCVEIEQKIPVLTQATKEFLDGYINGEFQHGNNPIMNWHVSCLSLKHDRNDNVAPDKPQRDNSQRRIDLVAATVNAMARACLEEKESEVRVLFV